MIAIGTYILCVERALEVVGRGGALALPGLADERNYVVALAVLAAD